MVHTRFVALACLAVLLAAAAVPADAHDSRKLLTVTPTPQQKATNACNQALTTSNSVGNGNSNGGSANGGNGGGNGGSGNGNGGLAGQWQSAKQGVLCISFSTRTSTVHSFLLCTCTTPVV